MTTPCVPVSEIYGLDGTSALAMPRYHHMLLPQVNESHTSTLLGNVTLVANDGATRTELCRSKHGCGE